MPFTDGATRGLLPRCWGPWTALVMVLSGCATVLPGGSILSSPPVEVAQPAPEVVTITPRPVQKREAPIDAGAAPSELKVADPQPSMPPSSMAPVVALRPAHGSADGSEPVPESAPGPVRDAAPEAVLKPLDVLHPESKSETPSETTSGIANAAGTDVPKPPEPPPAGVAVTMDSPQTAGPPDAAMSVNREPVPVAREGAAPGTVDSPVQNRPQVPASESAKFNATSETAMDPDASSPSEPGRSEASGSGSESGPRSAGTSPTVEPPAASSEREPVVVAVAAATAMSPRPGPGLARDWSEYRRAAALRMIAANPQGSYLTKAPDPLLAIPVVEVHLKEDGQIDQVLVIRSPTQALDTLRLLEAAIRRAGPFGPVTHLPKPWRFTEVFLFDHSRRFKPMILDQ